MKRQFQAKAKVQSTMEFKGEPGDKIISLSDKLGRCYMALGPDDKATAKDTVFDPNVNLPAGEGDQG